MYIVEETVSKAGNSYKSKKGIGRMKKERFQQEMQWRRKQEIHRIGEEWNYMADVNLRHVLIQLQKEWKGKSATVFLEKGMELKDRMNKTSKRLLEL